MRRKILSIIIAAMAGLGVLQPDAVLFTHADSANITESAAEVPAAREAIVSKADRAYALSTGASTEFKVNIPEDGLYTLELLYTIPDEQSESFAYSLRIDGEYPFEQCRELTAYALWMDDGEPRNLSNGDQSAPPQKHVEGFVYGYVMDKTGIQASPYEFLFNAGEHTVTVTAIDKEFEIAGIRLGVPERIRRYREVAAEYTAVPYKGEQIVIEAEKPLHKNSYSLTAKADNSSADISPKSPGRSLLNYIGGSTWKEANQEITWKFTVPEDGLYRIGFNYKQNGVTGGKTYRWLKIDGKTPFAEAANIGFSYCTKWKFYSFADEYGNDYLLHLTKGEHTISLAVTLADVAEVFERLEKIVTSLSKTYIDMVMITGEVPDANRDYELHKQIPDFEKTLKTNYEGLVSLSEDIGTRLEVNGELKGAVRNMARILKSMTDSLYTSHLYIQNYFSAYQTLSAWLYDIKNMPLSLDQIVIASPEVGYKTPKSGFLSRLGFGIKRFASSFMSSYNLVEIGENRDAPTIKIWVNWGRDQVKVLNTLIQESFAPENNVNVRVEQVNASLVQGVVSGTSPDLYLHMSRTEPVNLAMRGVLYDLKNFQDFEETLKRFQPGAQIPYKYKGGCYALPDTQDFFVMFYRTDILGRLGINPPKTWDEFITATGVLQRNNMNTYLPYVKIKAATTVVTGAGGLSIFPTMLMQHGGRVYNESLNATELGSAQSVKAFTLWTDFYTRFSLDADSNFIQRFRVGTTPLGITSYTNYMTFSATSPEIEGKWAVAQLPGVLQEDGSINNVCSGSGTGCGIMKSSKNKESAWKFLKWWTSAETQYRYSAGVESILGESGRLATANVEGMSRLSWDRDTLNTLKAQWSKVTEIPEVPGSYYVARSIDQAFWAVKNRKLGNKESITKWAEVSDKEIARKLKEYENK